MNSCFLGKNKLLWGFVLNEDGKTQCKVTQNDSEIVKRMLDYFYEENAEIHVMPKFEMPFVSIKIEGIKWYFLTSEQDANAFMKNIMVDGDYELCQII